MMKMMTETLRNGIVMKLFMMTSIVRSVDHGY